MVPPQNDHCDVEMQIWNSDGSPAEMCGNGARCIAVWMQREGRIKDTCRIGIGGRVVTAKSIRHEKTFGFATVETGTPLLLTPVDGQAVTLDDSEFILHRVQIGNPHAVLFVESLSDTLVHDIGRHIEHHSDSPQRTNVEFAVEGEANEIHVRVWERGSGETRACGSGACAVVAAGVHTGRLQKDEPYDIVLPGGTLQVQWRHNEVMLLAGPVEIVCTGSVVE